MELQLFVEVLGQVLMTSAVFYLIAGVLIGMAIGVFPGLGGIVGLSLTLPFIFGMDQQNGLALLLGLSAVTTTADSFTSILVGIPGTSGSQATILDGYKMARAGRGEEALGAAFMSSMIGGVIGAAALALALFAARPLILAFRAPHLLMLAIVGLAMVAVLTRGKTLLGILAACLGLLLSNVGAARTTFAYRFTFDLQYLSDGIPLVVLALGLFALPELIDLVVARASIAPANVRQDKSVLDGARESLRHKWLIARSGVLGSLLGMIPGVGGAVIDWIAYGAVSKEKTDIPFGTGNIRGVIAPESANNAKEGGALVPTLMFGVPGSGSMAVLLGGFMLLGVSPGPSLVTGDGLVLTYTMIWTLVVANVLATTLCLLFAKGVSGRITRLNPGTLAPYVIVIITVAAFQASQQPGDLIALVGFGALGWVMKRSSISRPALLIGFVLGASLERYLIITLARYGFEWLGWVSIQLMIVGIIVIVFGGRLGTVVRSVSMKVRNRTQSRQER